MEGAMHSMLGRWGMGTAALGFGLLAVGCGAPNGTVRAEVPSPGVAMTSPAANTGTVGAAAVGPLLVACQPDQRALVRQAFVNGQPVAQVECVGAGLAGPTYEAPFVRPGYSAFYGPESPVSDVRVVPVSQTIVREPVRRVADRRVVYDRVPERRTGRSVKKSAIIIGSSAGVGAGVGAAVGGKKGALIGAAIGGGSAAIWDQVTRDR
jgi:hypothetical protein